MVVVQLPLVPRAIGLLRITAGHTASTVQGNQIELRIRIDQIRIDPRQCGAASRCGRDRVVVRYVAQGCERRRLEARLERHMRVCGQLIDRVLNGAQRSRRQRWRCQRRCTLHAIKCNELQENEGISINT